MIGRRGVEEKVVERVRIAAKVVLGETFGLCSEYFP